MPASTRSRVLGCNCVKDCIAVLYRSTVGVVGLFEAAFMGAQRLHPSNLGAGAGDASVETRRTSGAC
jgi:hypothetical protein